jgi:CoA:oxalate CoA-transferase
VRIWPEIFRGRPCSKFSSALFQNVNRGKRAIALDLKVARSSEIVRALVETAYVVDEDFRPGVMDKPGLGWDALSALGSH